MKAPLGAFNQEKALVGAFSVTVKSSCNLREPSMEALIENQEPEKRSFENINLEQSSIACVMGDVLWLTER